MHRNNEANHYNRKYASSDKNWKYDQLFRTAHNEFMSRIKKVIIEKEFIEILDLGCGDGHRTSELLDHNNIALTGIDISTEGIKKANENKTDNSEYIVMNAEKQMFSPNSFDLIIDYGSFSSLNMNIVWPQLIEVLRPGGSIIGIETLGSNPIFMIKRKINYWRKLRTQIMVKNIVKFKTLNRWSIHFNYFHYKMFGLLSTIWAPFVALLPEHKFPERLIAITDYLDKYLLGLPSAQVLSYKSVFEFKSLQK